MNTYEGLSLLLDIAMLVVSILTYMNAKNGTKK